MTKRLALLNKTLKYPDSFQLTFLQSLGSTLISIVYGRFHIPDIRWRDEQEVNDTGSR